MLSCYIPLYIYPDWYNGPPTYQWTPLIDAITNNPTVQFYIVLNINNGPDASQNADYVHGIADLIAASTGNLKILGYVFTSYGARLIADVKADIDSWNNFYNPNIDGILLDEMASVTGSESYYTEITDYAKTTVGLSEVWGNPGNPTIESYIPTVDTIIVYEGTTQPSLSIFESSTFYPNYNKSKFAVNIFAQTVFDEQYIRDLDAAQYISHLHYTDDTLPNPYDTFATYLNDLLILLVSLPPDSSPVSYVQGVDYISITAEVRELARSVINSSVDFTDAEIIRYQYMRYSQIRTITDKDNWASTDREFGALQLIETKLAAADIMQHYGTANDVAVWQAMIAEAMDELKETVENMEATTGGGAESGNIVETDYKSWNLNPNVPPPNRLSNVGISEIDF